MSRSTWWPRRAQGAYYIVTGLWPVVAPRHYMVAAGQDSHQGVAQGLGAAVAGVGVALALDLIPSHVARWVGVGTAVALAAGAGTFVARGRGVPVNLTDAAVQLVFAGSWLARGRGSNE